MSFRRRVYLGLPEGFFSLSKERETLGWKRDLSNLPMTCPVSKVSKKGISNTEQGTLNYEGAYQCHRNFKVFLKSVNTREDKY